MDSILVFVLNFILRWAITYVLHNSKQPERPFIGGRRIFFEFCPIQSKPKPFLRFCCFYELRQLFCNLLIPSFIRLPNIAIFCLFFGTCIKVHIYLSFYVSYDDLYLGEVPAVFIYIYYFPNGHQILIYLFLFHIRTLAEHGH